jgi:hypothetical protein
MSKGRHRFRQSDLTKAIKVAVKAGVTVGRVQITAAGDIIIIAGTPEQGQNSSTAELDRELAEWESRHAN